jgi:hypothetical protein
MTYDRPIGIAPLPALNAAAVRPRAAEVRADGESFHKLLDRQESEPVEAEPENRDAEWKPGGHGAEKPETHHAEDPRNPRTAAPVAVVEPSRPSERADEAPGVKDGKSKVEGRSAVGKEATEATGSSEISRPSQSSNSLTAGRDAVKVTQETKVPAGGLLINPAVVGEQAAPELAEAAAGELKTAEATGVKLSESEMPICEAPPLEQTATGAAPEGGKAAGAKLGALVEMVRPVGKAVTAALAMLRAAGRVSEQNLEEKPVAEIAAKAVAGESEPVRQSAPVNALAALLSGRRTEGAGEGEGKARQTAQAVDAVEVMTRAAGRVAEYQESRSAGGAGELVMARPEMGPEPVEVAGQGRISSELPSGSARQAVLEGVLIPMAKPAMRVTEAETPVSKSAQVLEMLNARAAVRPEAVRRPEPVSQAEPESGYAAQARPEPAVSAAMPQVVTRVQVPANPAPAATPVPLETVPGAAAAARLEAMERPVFQSVSPLKSVSIPVGDQMRPSAVIHLLQQTAGVKVTVQSSDAGLSQALRTELPQLVSRLEDVGFQSSFQHRGAAPTDPAAAGILRSGSSSMRDSGFQESGSRDSQAEGSWSGRQQQRQSRLWKDLLQDERKHAKEGA